MSAGSLRENIVNRFASVRTEKTFPVVFFWKANVHVLNVPLPNRPFN